jgi:phenylacetate-CoA ligase
MHFSAGELIHVELIDPDSQENIELMDGAVGELVYTHLQREAAPLLRFRSRDHVQVWSSKCACGSTALRVRCIGRTDDMLIVRGVNVFPSAVREVVARFQPRVTGAILIQPRSRGVRQEPPLPIVVEGEAGLADAIAAEIRAALTFSAQVRMVAPKTLPRSDYKSKLVDFSGAA